jgi:hypothetical protein
MKTMQMIGMILFAFVASVTWGQTTTTPTTGTTTTDDTKLNETVTTTEEEVKLDGAVKVRQKLADRYEVPIEDIEALRAKKMGYGEINLVYALAKNMEGGVTQENIDKILELRSGEQKMGWGQVAKKLDSNVGKALKDSKSTTTVEGGTTTGTTSADTTTSSKGLSDKGSRPEKSSKPEKSEKVERSSKPERVEKSEKPERGHGKDR